MRTDSQFFMSPYAVLAMEELSDGPGRSSNAVSGSEEAQRARVRRAHAWARARAAWHLPQRPSSSPAPYRLQPPPARRMSIVGEELHARSSPALSAALEPAAGDDICTDGTYRNSPASGALRSGHFGHSTPLSTWPNGPRIHDVHWARCSRSLAAQIAVTCMSSPQIHRGGDLARASDRYHLQLVAS